MAFTRLRGRLDPWRRGARLAALLTVAAAAAGLGLAVAPDRAAQRPSGVRSVSAPARLPIPELATAGLRVVVRLANPRGVVRVRLRRPSGSPLAARTVRVRGRERLAVRLRLPAAKLRSVSPGRYTVEARAGSSSRRLTGAIRRARVLLLAVPAPTGPGVVVAAAGDVACDGVCGQEATASIITSRIKPRIVLGLGDYQYNTSTLANLKAHYDPYWGRFKSITYAINGGSHDFYGTGDYLTYFNDGGPVTLRPEASYSFDVGAWHVIALNSYCFERSSCDRDAWTAWLRRDLAAHPTRCTLAYYHEPYWTTPSDHDPDTRLRPWIKALYDAGTDLILQGHNHLYERFAPQTPDSRRDDARGIVAFTVGTGGRSHYPFHGAPAPNSLVRNDDTYGVLALTLRPTGYDFRFVPVAGRSFTDSGSGTCH